MVRPELDDTQAAPSGDPAHTATLSPRAGAGPAAELAAGLRLDHFRIEHKLGAGGMGEVYLATDLALDRPVAIKVLPAGSSSGTARDRLVREARAQARVHHPNVGHIYYIGEDGGRLYFAMEHLAGGTLADRLAAGPMPVEHALAAIRAAALGLREAQTQGFLHRDVKPSNLMLDAHGVVKVLDFGLAASAPERASADGIKGPVAQTTLAGTPLYMAPEQARGEAIDLRADIYALGATLYHLVSGKPPFEADSVDELITLHRSAARPTLPRKGRARTTSVAIDALVARMMAPDPADRFASYDELLRALELASTAHTRPAGFWVRTIAAGLDTTLVYLVTAIFLAVTGLSIEGNLLAMPAILVLEALSQARWGASPGMALFELEVVSLATEGRPRFGAAIARAAVMLGPIVVAQWAMVALDERHAGGLAHLAGLVVALLTLVYPLVVLAHAAWRVPHKRAPWDRVAGTMVRYRTTRGPAAA